MSVQGSTLNPTTPIPQTPIVAPVAAKSDEPKPPVIDTPPAQQPPSEPPKTQTIVPVASAAIAQPAPVAANPAAPEKPAGPIQATPANPAKTAATAAAITNASTDALKQAAASKHNKATQSKIKGFFAGIFATISNLGTAIKGCCKSFTCCHKAGSTQTKAVAKQKITPYKQPLKKRIAFFFTRCGRKIVDCTKSITSICKKAPPPVTTITIGSQQFVVPKKRNMKDSYNATYERRNVFQENQQIIKHGVYISFDQKQIERMQQKTEVIEKVAPIDPNVFKPKYDSTIVKVCNVDTLTIASQMIFKEGLNPLVLSLANAEKPLGFTEEGCMAQEENIGYRSTLDISLEPAKNPHLAKQLKKTAKGDPIYAIPEFGAIYSPEVFVFRKQQEQNFAIMEPFTTHILSAAADNVREAMPFDRTKGWDENMEILRTRRKEKLRSHLRIAIIKGHDSFLGGAPGCGVFGQDSKDVAKDMREVLEEKEFKGQFKAVYFAILESRENNYGNFAEAMKNVKVGG